MAAIKKESDKKEKDSRRKVLIVDLEETLVSGNELVEDALKFLEKVRKEYVVVLLSNHTEAKIKEILSSHLLYPYFDLVVSATDYDMRKPDPRIIGVIRTLLYDKFERKFDLRNFWMVGDRPDRDILLGNLAGIKTIRVRRGKYADRDAEFEEEMPKHEVSSLTEAAEILLSTRKKSSTKKKEKAKSTRKTKKK